MGVRFFFILKKSPRVYSTPEIAFLQLSRLIMKTEELIYLKIARVLKIPKGI